MNRDDLIHRIRNRPDPWDMIVIGGGATGVGIAVDAASRGYDVALLEQSDFGKGTSSRSTKLVHGGVRYLQQGNVSLVMEALKERGILRTNAPHLVHDLRFIVPRYDWWEAPFYGIGLKVYDLLAGRYGFGPSRVLNRDMTIELIPTIKTEGLRGGVQYFDGQFDDARLLVNLVQTAAEHGAAPVNYVQVTGLTKDDEGIVTGVTAEDLESGERLEVPSRVVINATGPFADGVRQMDTPAAPPMISPSQGAHIVLDRSFLPGDTAIMVPHTSDGRVMFAIPWYGRTLVGTTDTPIEEPQLEPVALDEEVEFILETAGAYLHRPPGRADVLSVFAGIRPLVRAGEGGNTAELSRDHTIHIAPSGLLTICGGKWTTYRNMAEDCVDQAAMLAELEERPCLTREVFFIDGSLDDAEALGDMAFYGADAHEVERLIESDPRFADPLHERLPYRAGEVVWSVRHEMARTVDDYLSRRSRAILFDARAAIERARRVAELMARELGRDESWRRAQVDEFGTIGRGYVLG